MGEEKEDLGSPLLAVLLASVYERIGDQRTAAQCAETFLAHPLSRQSPEIRLGILRVLLGKYQLLRDLEGQQHTAERLLQESQSPQDQILARSVLLQVGQKRADWEAVEIHAVALLTLAQEAGDLSAQTLAHMGLAIAGEQKGEIEKAINHARHVVGLAKDPETKALWMLALGSYWERLGKLSEACTVYEAILKEDGLAQAHPVRRLARLQLAYVLAQAGDIPKALDLAEKTEVASLPVAFQVDARSAKCAIYRLGGRLDAVEVEIQALWTLAKQYPNEASVQVTAQIERARLHWDRGKLAAAVGAAEEALTWAVRLDSRASEIDCLILLADLHQSSGNLDQAERYLTDAEEEITKGHFLFKRVFLRISQGALAARQGRYNLAEALFTEAAAQAQQLGAKAAECVAHLLYAVCVKMPQGNWEAIGELLDHALTLALRCDYRVLEALATGLIGLWHLEGHGDRTRAYHYLKDSRHLMDELGFYGPFRSTVEDALFGIEP